MHHSPPSPCLTFIISLDEPIEVVRRAGLERALRAAAETNAQLDPDRVLAVWDLDAVRADVLADYRRSQKLGIQGSPQIYWPDGTSTHNPGMTDHRWLRGIPRIASTDPGAPARLLRDALTR